MTYDPLADSSIGTADLRAMEGDHEDNPGISPDALILDISSDPAGFKVCFCGCRTEITSKASFKQGHDQRLVGKLVRAGRAGVEVAIDSGGMLTHTSAIGAAEHLFPTTGGVEKVAMGLALAIKTIKPKKAPQPLAVEHGTVKIGRWTYPAIKDDNGVKRNDKPNGQGKWVAVQPSDAAFGSFVPA